MISNIWPEASHLEETISTLRFASRMMRVSNETSVNIQLDPQILLKKYEKEIRDLKLELAMHDTLAGRGRISYEPYNEEQQAKMQEIAEEYLNDKKEDIEIESIRQVKELFIQMRNTYRNVMMGRGDIDSTEGFRKQKTKLEELKKKESTMERGDDENQVGKEIKKFGFGMGKAPKNSKPTFQMEKSIVGNKINKSKVTLEEAEEAMNGEFEKSIAV